MKDLSIIIPAYNEEHRIKKTIEDYIKFLKNKINFEILIILNGCKDNTLNIVEELLKKNKEIKYKNYEEAIGKGGAIIEGFKIANGNLIGFVDADGSTKPEHFYELYKKIGSYGGIIASRWIKGSKVTVRQPFFRRIASRGFNSLVRTLFFINIKDTQCGAKVFKSYVINKIVYKLGLTKWAFDIDLLYNTKKFKFKIKEIPSEWNEAEGSHLNLNKAIPEMFLSIIRLRLMYSPFNFIVKAYNIIKDKKWKKRKT